MPRGSSAPMSRPVRKSRTLVDTRVAVMATPVVGLRVPSKMRLASIIEVFLIGGMKRELDDARLGISQSVHDADGDAPVGQDDVAIPLLHPQEEVSLVLSLEVQAKVDRPVDVDA